MFHLPEKGTDACSTHFIRAVVLEKLALLHLQTVTYSVSHFEDEFRRRLDAKRAADVKWETAQRKKQMARAEQRLAELSLLYKRMYADTVLNDLIHKVFVSAPDKSSGRRKQNIFVSYDFVGILPELSIHKVSENERPA